jgi:uncharacterized protein (UPF0333 family)
MLTTPLAIQVMMIMMTHHFRLLLIVLALTLSTKASYILIPMDEDSQKDHLKAYGIAFWTLENDQTVDWLLNYRGGSFLIENKSELEKECVINRRIQSQNTTRTGKSREQY